MILLDTCVLLWLASGSEDLSGSARKAIGNHPGSLVVSAISAWEIGIKAAKGHLSLPVPVDEWMERACARHGIRPVALDHMVAALSTRLPTIHADPADRFLIATAQALKIAIITPDQHIRQYPDIQTVW
ncbi:MAG: type II toxin-antitoxin system VapC family toxin [Terrimicrobiaceae bacterium]